MSKIIYKTPRLRGTKQSVCEFPSKMRMSQKRRVLSVVILLGLLVTTWIYDFNDYYYMNFGESRGLTTYDLFKSVTVMWNRHARRWAAKASATYKKELAKIDPPEASWIRPELPVYERESRIEQCNCTRKINATEDHEGDGVPSWVGYNNFSSSTCSPHSYDRGPHQKIIGYSFYTNKDSSLDKSRKYFQGITDNLRLIPKYYPGWVLRLYYDVEPGNPLMESLCKVACEDSNIDLCYVRDIPAKGDVSDIFAMIWRFLPILDKQVSHYLSRDLDSWLNAREAAAVEDWLTNTDSAFHFMRDHPSHVVEILGSAWGVRLRPMERSMMIGAFREAQSDSMYWAPRHAYGPDQGFLKTYVWPWAKWSSVSHDSYHCRKFPFTKPFPTRRPIESMNYVASVNQDDDILEQQCPVECRPKGHEDWVYC